MLARDQEIVSFGNKCCHLDHFGTCLCACVLSSFIFRYVHLYSSLVRSNSAMVYQFQYIAFKDLCLLYVVSFVFVIMIFVNDVWESGTGNSQSKIICLIFFQPFFVVPIELYLRCYTYIQSICCTLSLMGTATNTKKERHTTTMSNALKNVRLMEINGYVRCICVV